jgi:hypothetical protein
VRRVLRPAVLAVTTVALVATGGLIAYAGWSSGTDSESFTFYAAAVPRVPAPRAYVQDAAVAPGDTTAEPAPVRPRIGWKAVRISADVPVHRYVVTRHLGPVTEVVCDRPATTALRCVDRTAPAGYRMTYSVAARYGDHWVGKASDRSAAVTTPGVAVPVTVNGVPVLPGVDGEPIVPGVAPSASPSADAGSAPAAPSGAPSPEPSDDDDSGTGVIVPPRPPGTLPMPSESVTDAPPTTEPETGGTPTGSPGNGPPPGLPGPPPALPATPGLNGPPPGLPS